MPLIIDCDPGKDDAVALAIAVARRKELDLAAVTTVAGNVNVTVGTENALRVLGHCRAPDVPVHRGAATPLEVEAVHAAHVHGPDGLGGVPLPRSESRVSGVSAVTRLVGSPDYEPATIAALGPLTNLANAIMRQPACARRWNRVVAMGGSLSRGNVTPHAEYNFYADPHAVANVLACDAPVTLLTLDVTRDIVPDATQLARLARSESPGAQLFARLWKGTAFAIHDACVIAFLLESSLFETRTCRLRITLDGDRRGQSSEEDEGDEVELVVGVSRSRLLDRIESWLEFG